MSDTDLIETPPPAVPIAKSSVDVVGWMLVVTVQCPCIRPRQVRLVTVSDASGVTGDIGLCAGCGRALSLSRIDVNAQDELDFTVTISDPSPAPETEGADV